MFKKSKKGVDLPISTVGALIIIVVTAVILIAVLVFNFMKADETWQIRMCKFANVGMVSTEKEFVGGWIDLPFHFPKMCYTLSKKKTYQQPPTKEYLKKYNNAKETAAYAEVGDMLKNCWYMWLEGSDERVFPDPFWEWGRQGCFVCYTFRVSDDVDSFTYQELLRLHKKRPYFAEDSSDKCAGGRGGYLAYEHWGSLDRCPEGSGWVEVDSKMADDKGDKCCVREDILDECTNKGGKCLGKDEDDEGYQILYSGWSCPVGKTCYVEEENYYTYIEYITSYGDRGGHFVYKEGDTECDETDEDCGTTDLRGKILAISFYSKEGKTPYIMLSTLDDAKVDELIGETKCEVK